ncbi:MAG: hypothetical protein WD648_00540, partial [Planctomycetaceae bacterium]
MRVLLSVVLLVAMGQGAISGEADDISITRVIGLESPGSYKHPATITELRNGDLYIAYYGGEGEYEGDTAVFGLRKRKGSNEWG